MKERVLNIFCLVIAIIWFSLLSAILTQEATRDAMRDTAIEDGVAEWTIDAKTGARQFKWKMPIEKEEQPCQPK